MGLQSFNTLLLIDCHEFWLFHLDMSGKLSLILFVQLPMQFELIQVLENPVGCFSKLQIHLICVFWPLVIEVSLQLFMITSNTVMESRDIKLPHNILVVFGYHYFEPIVDLLNCSGQHLQSRTPIYSKLAVFFGLGIVVDLSECLMKTTDVLRWNAGAG